MLNYIKNMKPRYLGFRVFYLIQSKLGVLKLRFPINPTPKIFLSKSEWLEFKIPFFEQTGDYLLNEDEIEILIYKAENILKHKYTFFSSTEFNLGDGYDWVTNPDTGFKYNIKKHWTEINDFSKEAGDIKFVWEKSRFSFLYDLIRYDYHCKKDVSEFVFQQIEDFIDKNPINQGPNYKCSQEISLRVLNWAFALFYYKNSSSLSEERFQKIVNSIYYQLNHVYSNINFSRIAVRNNHAITETSLLYLSGFLFPFFKESSLWHKKGKKWLLKELNYQIYDDGSYLQFSHNYHRVVIQTLSWVLSLNELNKVSFGEIINQKIEITLNFLYQHQDEITGWLPNYGNNDGALFFPLNNNHYRDFRPQLQVLGILLNKKLYEQSFEDAFWFGLSKRAGNGLILAKKSLLSFKDGGFYGFNDDALTTIRCGKYKDRPSQADALHLDVWYNGVNILFDPGTYKYNTEKKVLDYYMGTQGHNTLTIGNQDQMVKGGRFIWYYWTKRVKTTIHESSDSFIFNGEIHGFPLLGKDIYHRRTVVKQKTIPIWKIIDETNYKGEEKIFLHWNINPEISDKILIQSTNRKGDVLSFLEKEGWYSECYAVKENYKQKVYEIFGGYCETTIEILK